MNKKKKLLKKRKIEKKVISHLNQFIREWKRVFANEKVAEDPAFLETLAENIKNLDEDAKSLEKTTEMQPIGQLIHDILTKQWGVSCDLNPSLLEASLNFSPSSAQNSDLSRLIENFSQYSSQIDNEFLALFGLFSEIIPSK